jgi:hypothetical protein
VNIAHLMVFWPGSHNLIILDLIAWWPGPPKPNRSLSGCFVAQAMRAVQSPSGNHWFSWHCVGGQSCYESRFQPFLQ